MDIEGLIKNMNPKMLSDALSRMNGVLSPEQLKMVENAVKTTNKGALNQKLNNLSAADLQKELKSNPDLAKQLAGNPELMKKINSIFKK